MLEDIQTINLSVRIELSPDGRRTYTVASPAGLLISSSEEELIQFIGSLQEPVKYVMTGKHTNRLSLQEYLANHKASKITTKNLASKQMRGTRFKDLENKQKIEELTQELLDELDSMSLDELEALV